MDPSEDAVRKFESNLHGEVLRPSHPGYDPARRIFNAMIDKRPALIVCCREVPDVQRAVEFARRYDLLVAVRGGGHNVAGKALCDNGMVIDLSAMKRIRVDPAARTVRAEPGLTWGEFDRETQAHGLATTGGFISSTGVPGLTLGGGLGWLMRKHGLACDNLRAVDMVTADAHLLIADAGNEPDLFWAALRFYRELMARAPDELMAYAVFLTAPEGSRLFAIPVCYVGPLEAGEQMLRPLGTFGPPVADTVQPMAYLDIQRMFDPGFPSGRLNYWKSNFRRALTDEAIDTIIAQFAAAPSPFSSVALGRLEGRWAASGSTRRPSPIAVRATASSSSECGPTRRRRQPTSGGPESSGTRCSRSRVKRSM